MVAIKWTEGHNGVTHVQSVTYIRILYTTLTSSWLMYMLTTLTIPPSHWYLPLVNVEVLVVLMWSAALLPLVVWYTVRLGEVGTVCPAPSVHVSGCVELAVEQSMTATLLEPSGGRMSPTLVYSTTPLSKIMALFGMRWL